MTNPLVGANYPLVDAQLRAIFPTLGAGLWGLGILVAIFYLVHGILGIAHHRPGGPDNGGHPDTLRESKKEAVTAGTAIGRHPGSLRESQTQAVNAGVALSGLIMLAVIVEAILTVFS
jgi:hypothetical protein